MWRAGGTFQEWSEHFALDRWLDAMAAEGLDPDWYVTRHRTLDEVLPWDHITAGLHKDFLWQDWQAALAEHGLPDCRWTPCYDCGVCTGLRARARRGLPGAARGRQPGHRPGPRRGERRCRRRPGPLPGYPPERSAVAVRGDTGFPVRLMYTKRGKIRWISHRDVARAMERAFRVTQLPLAFSEGFSPRPKVSFGLALSTGHESDAEYLDLEFLHEVDCDDLPPVLSEALPDGMAVVAAAPLVERAPALQEAVTAVVWQVEVVRGDGTPATPAVLDAYVEAALAAPELPTERHKKGREVVEDVRPVIRRIDVEPLAMRSGRHRRRHSSWSCPRSRGARSRERSSRRSRESTASPTSSSRRARCVRINGSSATARGGNRRMPTPRPRTPKARAS